MNIWVAGREPASITDHRDTSAALPASSAHRAWMANIDRNAVSPDIVADVVRSHGISRDSFRMLDAMESITDRHGKSFFVIPPGTGVDAARRAVLLTYILNAGTGYGSCCGNDFPDTPYGEVELRRIIERQRANRWSYQAVRVMTHSGGCLLTTPNGILMGMGGNWIHAQFSRRGGTMWGDVFLVNVAQAPQANHAADPVAQMRQLIDAERLHPEGPELHRVLHHEEIHAQQWAKWGPLGMPIRYLADEARAQILSGANNLEKHAGLSDGGYE